MVSKTKGEGKQIMHFQKIWTLLATVFLGMISTGMASAQDRVGVAVEKQLNFQESATELMTRLTDFHDMLLIVITVITIFVFALLAYVMVKFSRKANPVPSTTSHNTFIEIIWTAVPVIILLAILVPSMRLLYFQDTIPESDVVIKATAHQWYWTYEYPDEGGFSFDSIMLPDSYFTDNPPAEKETVVADIMHLMNMDEAPEMYRLLETDTRIVVPVGKNVKMVVTADDVIHAWTIPAFGAKVDAVPGRINELWFNVEEPGTYYGQCSELCGVRHAFMPIVVQAVSEEDYQAWLGRAKAFYAGIEDDSPVRVVMAGE